MSVARLARPMLFIYELIRLFFIAHKFSAIQPTHPGAFPWAIYMAANAFFSIMAFFIWINPSQYKAYMPLFISGKTIIIFMIVVWIGNHSKEIMLEQMMSSGDSLTPLSAATVLFLGDVFSIICAGIINRNLKKTAINAGHGA